MRPDPALQSQLRDMMNKAHRALKAAQRHLADADFDFAASRCYYAAFYAIEAALLTKGVTRSTHSGAIAAFSEQFIKPGFFPAEFGAKTSRLSRERQTGDYEFDISVTADDAADDRRAAAELVDAIANHLRATGFLPDA